MELVQGLLIVIVILLCYPQQQRWKIAVPLAGVVAIARFIPFPWDALLAAAIFGFVLLIRHYQNKDHGQIVEAKTSQ